MARKVYKGCLCGYVMPDKVLYDRTNSIKTSRHMYYRRVALFVLRDKDGRVLLQYKDKNAPFLPEHWAFFGGGIDENETPEEAAKREAKEEIGIELDNIRFFRRYEFQEEKGLYEKFVFIAPLEHSPVSLKKQQEEGQDLGLFSFEELKKLKVSNNDRAILKDLFNK